MLIIPKETALDLTIKGSVGSFSVSSLTGDRSSVRVQYLQTHIGFAVAGDAEERLLENLAPVREVFNVQELEFDELMQRDIDDGRVSSELIPYLLEEDGSVLVKFFPPIIVVVLPTNSTGRPAPLYPAVVSDRNKDPNIEGAVWDTVRSGPVGGEAFEFRQILDAEGKPQPHDYAQLKLNTTKCRLAIVDGQHRAMALLALYRNYKQWPDGAQKYKSYYARWARSEIQRFDLSGIKLPIVLCTFPDVAEGSETPVTVTEACRSVFLALNKNARPVSRARNYLLDDGDICAHFLRSTLGHIKAQDDGSPLSVRIWNVELDPAGDRRALSSTVAFTGVMHLFGLIELLLLRRKEINGLNAPRQNLWKVKNLNDVIRRLGAKDELGAARAAAAHRRLLDPETTEVLTRRYDRTYGRTLILALDEFGPYRIMAEASVNEEQKLRADPNGAFYHSILFEGQGQQAVFDEYTKTLSDLVREYDRGPLPPALKGSADDFSSRNTALREIKERFYIERAASFFAKQDLDRQSPYFQASQDVFRNTLTTEAFQIALVATFWLALESASPDIFLSPDAQVAGFKAYLGALNEFFGLSVLQRRAVSIPAAEQRKRAARVVKAMYGQIRDDGTLAPNSRCFKKILVPGELKPDEWTKFRYLLLEVWCASGSLHEQDERVVATVEAQKSRLRRQALTDYESRCLSQEAKKQGLPLAELGEKPTAEVKNEARKAFATALKVVGASDSTISALEQLLSDRTSVAPFDDEDEDDDEDDDDDT